MELPRSAAAVAGELRVLLRAAAVPPPYLLVVHSLAGAYARRYAQLYPDEVAAVLFLEPFYEEYRAMTAKRAIADTAWQILAVAGLALHIKPFCRRMFSQQFASWPPAVRAPLVEYDPKTLRNTMKERKNLFTEIEPETRDGGGLPDVPVIALAATGIDAYRAMVMPAAQPRSQPRRAGGQR